jgi:hypothetical protein
MIPLIVGVIRVASGAQLPMEQGLTYSMPLEIFMPAALVRGILETNLDRVSSHLLFRQEDQVFSLRDATVEDFNGQPIVSRATEYVVYMREIYLIADLSPVGQSQRSGLETLYQKKDSSRALISVGPFLIQGDVYLLPGGALYDLLLGKNQFIPLTNATILGRPPVAPRTYLINRQKIGFMTAIGDGLVEF